METKEELELVKKKWEIRKLIKENYMQYLTGISLVISILYSLNIKSISIPDLSKSNKLTPHKVEKISFIDKRKTTAAKFWYSPIKDKNQGYQLKIMDNQYVLIKASHKIKVSILNSKGDFIPLVSFTNLDWVFQTTEKDNYIIVISGDEKSQILIDIPPKSKQDNIMEIK